jgi:hypothetical protein
MPPSNPLGPQSRGENGLDTEPHGILGPPMWNPQGEGVPFVRDDKPPEQNLHFYPAEKKQFWDLTDNPTSCSFPPHDSFCTLHIPKDNSSLFYPRTPAVPTNVPEMPIGLSSTTMMNNTDFAGRAIVPRRHTADFSDRELRLYLENSTKHHAYWLCIYKDPPTHEDVMRRRGMGGATADQAFMDLSNTELRALLDKFPGTEILIDHKPQRTLGVIIEATQDPVSGTVRVLARPYNSEEGIRMAEMLEFGVMSGVSLQHIRQGDNIQVREVSLCTVGRRPETWHECTIVLSDAEQAHLREHEFIQKESRMYQHPEFVVSCAALKMLIGDEGLTAPAHHRPLSTQRDRSDQSNRTVQQVLKPSNPHTIYRSITIKS